jgi:hypothetical protein
MKPGYGAVTPRKSIGRADATIIPTSMQFFLSPPIFGDSLFEFLGSIQITAGQAE